MTVEEIEYAIIIGCGRFGAHLTKDMALENPELQLVVVDSDKYAFNRLPSNFAGTQLDGDATDIDVLKQANIERANLVIAATNRDSINIFVAQMAKKIFNVPKVIALIFEPSRQTVYEKINITTICPSDLTTAELKTMMHDQEDI